MKKIKSKLEALVSSILPYLQQQISNAMGEKIEVMIIVMDKKGDAQGFCTLPDDFQMAMLHGLLEEKKGQLALRSLH